MWVYNYYFYVCNVYRGRRRDVRTCRTDMLWWHAKVGVGHPVADENQVSKTEIFFLCFEFFVASHLRPDVKPLEARCEARCPSKRHYKHDWSCSGGMCWWCWQHKYVAVKTYIPVSCPPSVDECSAVKKCGCIMISSIYVMYTGFDAVMCVHVVPTCCGDTQK